MTQSKASKVMKKLCAGLQFTYKYSLNGDDTDEAIHKIQMYLYTYIWEALKI